MQSQNDLRQSITNTIIEALKNGGLPRGNALGATIRMLPACTLR